MTLHTPISVAMRNVARLAEGLVTTAALFVITVITLVCIAVFSTNWQSVMLYLFGT